MRQGSLGTLIALSCVATAPAQVLPDGPLVNVIASPRESRAGWHTSPVTLTFSCAPKVPPDSCHGPVVFSSDGAEQALTITTRDGEGHDIISSVTVNVDTTPPSISLRAPLSGVTTTEPILEVVASVADVTSGLLRVTCNGGLALITGRTARCVVPLAIGLNAVVVHAMDVAGNSASAGTTVTRDAPAGSFRVFPHSITTVVGRTDILKVVTDAGTDPSGVTWRSTDSTVASVEPYGAYVQLASKANRDATIAARSTGHTAHATMSIVESADDRPPAGTAVWSIAASAGLIPQPPIEAYRADDGDPDLFSVDADPSGSSSLVRALDNRGIPLWIGIVPGHPLFGDRFGGLIARLGSPGGPSRAIGRFGNNAFPIWRFEALGEITDVAQTEDGVIYLVEHIVESLTPSRPSRNEMNVVTVDGRTGLAIARWPLGEGRVRLGPLFVDSDRAVYVQILDRDTLAVIRITTKGIETLGTLWKRNGPESPVRPGPVVVNGRLWVGAGALMTFCIDDSGPVSRLHIARIGYGAVTEIVRERRMPGVAIHALVDAFNERLLYLADGSVLEAVDVVSGRSLWTMKTSAIPMVALEDAHVVVNDVTNGRVLELDEKGEIVDSFAASISHELTYGHSGDLVLGQDPATGATVQVAFPERIQVNAGWFTTLTIR
jgi:hypothetical protein